MKIIFDLVAGDNEEKPTKQDIQALEDFIVKISKRKYSKKDSQALMDIMIILGCIKDQVPSRR